MVEMPATLVHAVEEALGALRGDPRHESHQRYRRPIYDALGPRGAPSRRTARTLLAILAAERVLPIYQAIVPARYGPRGLHPRKVIATAMQLVRGEIAEDAGLEAFWDDAYHLSSHPILVRLALHSTWTGAVVEEVRHLLEAQERLRREQPATREEQIDRDARDQRLVRAINNVSRRADSAYRSAYSALCEARGFEGLNETTPLQAPVYSYAGEAIGPDDWLRTMYDGRVLLLAPNDAVLSVVQQELTLNARDSTEWDDLRVGTTDWGDAAAAAALAVAWDPALRACHPDALLGYWEWWYTGAVPLAWDRARQLVPAPRSSAPTEC